jgi:hypothetical protein
MYIAFIHLVAGFKGRSRQSSLIADRRSTQPPAVLCLCASATTYWKRAVQGLRVLNAAVDQLEGCLIAS